jgi:cell division protein FtsW
MASAPPYVPGSARTQVPTGVRGRRRRGADFLTWWHEIDRVLLVLVLLLMAVGTVAVAAASPASARRLSTVKTTLSDLHFLKLHLLFQAAGLIAMFAASILPREATRRAGILLAAAMTVALVLVLVPHVGVSVKGSHRWLNLGIQLQPSEFLKPAFAISLAWILSWRVRDPNMPVMTIATVLMGVVGVLLMAEPDFGATMLFAGVWFVLMLLSGLSLRRIAAACIAVVVGIGAAYLLYPNARNRIDSFVGGGTPFDQVDLAARTLVGGGWTGTGIWLGTRKLGLPEAHTDYIFSVIGEEFGLLVCGLIVLLYLAIIIRVLMRLVEEEDLFSVLAATGLVAQLGGQAFINILVNLRLFPSKGMTLPLISYGGSSTVALCLGVGFLLALTRRNPHLKRGPFNNGVAGGASGTRLPQGAGDKA